MRLQYRKGMRMLHNFFLDMRRMALVAAGLTPAVSINCSFAESTAALQGVVTGSSRPIRLAAKLVF
jgi:hypothetical protein